MSSDNDSFVAPPLISSIEFESSLGADQGPRDPPTDKPLLDSPITSDASPISALPIPNEDESTPVPDPQFNVVRNLNTENIDQGEEDEPDSATELSTKPDESQSPSEPIIDDDDDATQEHSSEARSVDNDNIGQVEIEPENTAVHDEKENRSANVEEIEKDLMPQDAPPSEVEEESPAVVDEEPAVVEEEDIKTVAKKSTDLPLDEEPAKEIEEDTIEEIGTEETPELQADEPSKEVKDGIIDASGDSASTEIMASTERCAAIPHGTVREDCILAGRELVAVFIWVAACQTALVAANSRYAVDYFPGWKPFTLWIGLFVGLMTVWEAFGLCFGSTLNPSVSIAFYLANGDAGGPGCKHRRAMAVSLVAQLFAHFAGIYTTRRALGTAETLKLFAPPLPNVEVLGFYGDNKETKLVLLMAALAIEALATCAMCFVILYVGHKAASPITRGGMTVLIISLLSVVFSSTTGAVMNPMQHMALAMIERSWRYHMSYLVGPVVGAWIAALSFNKLVGDQKVKLE